MSPTKKTLLAAAAILAPALLASARVAAGDAASGETAPPLFDAEPFSDERTPLPTTAEWAAAPSVRLDARAPDEACSARRLREWLKVRCRAEELGAMRMLGGARDGVQMRLVGTRSEFGEVVGATEIVVPVRRGDARVIEIMRIELGYKGMNSVEPWRVLSEVWPEEDERPTVVLQ